MPQDKFEPPPEIVAAFRRGIDDFVTSDDAQLKEELKQATFAAMPVFTATLPEVANGRFSGQAVGWRLLAISADGTRGLVIADIAIDTPQPRLVSVSRDEEEAGTFLQQYNNIQGNARISNQGYELRLLQVPGLMMDAFWLRLPEGTHEVVFPFPGFSTLENREYEMPAILGSLKELIPRFLAFDSPAGE